MWMPIPYKIFINVFLRRSFILNIINRSTANLMEKRAALAGDAAACELLDKRLRQLNLLYAVVDSTDFGQLRHTLTHTQAYKGLDIVDVEAVDGTIVKITL